MSWNESKNGVFRICYIYSFNCAFARFFGTNNQENVVGAQTPDLCAFGIDNWELDMQNRHVKIFHLTDISTVFTWL